MPTFYIVALVVVYIRKVKKSESKSQLQWQLVMTRPRLCISVKLKNLKANHNSQSEQDAFNNGCVYP